MKKLIFLLTFLLAMPCYGASTLWEYYNYNLPSISERIPQAEECGIENYRGTYEQNIELLDCLENSKLGTSIPLVVAVFETSLATKITSTQTTMTLVSGTTDDSTTLNGTYGFVIDESSASEEFVIATCVDTACSSMTRGISTVTGTSSVTALKSSHRRGASVKITDHPVLATIINILTANGTLPSKLTYDSAITISAGDSDLTVPTKKYIDDISIAGFATSTETVAGGGELGTQLEIASSSYDVNSPKFLHTRYATSSPDVRGLYVPVSENDGYLNQGWLDLSETFAFTGDNTFATSTVDRANITNLQVASTTITQYPTASTSIASKGYVDDKRTNISIKDLTGVTDVPATGVTEKTIWTECATDIIGATDTLNVTAYSSTDATGGTETLRIKLGNGTATSTIGTGAISNGGNYYVDLMVMNSSQSAQETWGLEQVDGTFGLESNASSVDVSAKYCLAITIQNDGASTQNTDVSFVQSIIIKN